MKRILTAIISVFVLLVITASPILAASPVFGSGRPACSATEPLVVKYNRFFNDSIYSYDYWNGEGYSYLGQSIGIYVYFSQSGQPKSYFNVVLGAPSEGLAEGYLPLPLSYISPGSKVLLVRDGRGLYDYLTLNCPSSAVGNKYQFSVLIYPRDYPESYHLFDIYLVVKNNLR